MPSVRDEYKNKLNVKSSFEPIFIEKFNNKNDFASQSERTLFFNHNFAPKSLNFNLDNKKSKKKDVEDRDTKTTKTHTNYEKIPQVYMKENIQIKPRINNEDVPNPLQKLKITKERKLSRISSRNSFEELNKDVKDLALTIKDLSVPFPLREKPILDNNIIKPPEKIEEDWNTKRNSEYIENFLKHKNPLRRHLNEFHEENNHDSSCMSRSSLFSMKNYFKNINNLKINDEELNSEEILNTRIRLNNTREHFKEKQMSEEELSEFMNQTNNFLTDNNNENAYDINNFITDMMDIYIDRKKDVNEKSDFLQKEDLKLFEHDKENLNMKLKCLSPVYREMKISARNLEPNKLKENNSEFSVKKRNSMHDFSSYEHRKSTYIQPNFYQKNRDFSQFSNHFSQGNSKETCIEPENKITYRDIKEKINVRRVI